MTLSSMKRNGFAAIQPARMRKIRHSVARLCQKYTGPGGGNF